MKKLSCIAFFAFIAALCLVSCEPAVFSMLIDMRQPSKSGLVLSGKTVSVVYMDDLSGRDTVFNAMVAEGFAKALEEDYFEGRETINIYRMEKDMAGNYASKDTLITAAVNSGDDVIFLFDSPVFSEPVITRQSEEENSSEEAVEFAVVDVPFKLNLYTYDTMGRDTVVAYSGKSSVKQRVPYRAEETDEEIEESLWLCLADAGKRTGTRSASNFLSNWKTETFYFYFYDSSAAWYDASIAAYEYKWHEAIENWMKVLDTNNLARRGAAEFNIAQACYLLGDYELSEAWLAQARKDGQLPLCDVLQRRLDRRK